MRSSVISVQMLLGEEVHVHKSCNLPTKYLSSYDFSTLCTSMSHDLTRAKMLSLVKWCFNRESKTYLCTSDKAGVFSDKKYDSYTCWTCTELCEAFTFLVENIYVQFDSMVYQQIVGIPMGTNCAPLIADLFLYCYERDFMSNLQKSERFDLIDKFNDTSRYIDNIFTIDNLAFAEQIPDICPRELQLEDANMYRYHKLRKTFGKFLGHTLNFCPNLVQYRFKNMYLKESLTRSSMVILSTN